MKLYRAKAVAVEAIQFKHTEALRLFAGKAVGAISEDKYADRVEKKAMIRVIEVATLKSRDFIFEGEWLIKCIENDSEFFIVCDDEFFNSTYEPID
ncbi:MAG: hypothetical protein K2Q45_10975 [Nitrosomonas sp.]|nr:hypothetical protein [Nitrosomonas sp.]